MDDRHFQRFGIHTQSRRNRFSDGIHHTGRKIAGGRIGAVKVFKATLGDGV